MNKNTLYIVVALAVGITGLSFFISKSDATKVCYTQDVASQGGVSLVAAPVAASSTADSPPTKAVVRGFPSPYYQEPFPGNCLPADGISAAGSFKPGPLGADFLVWLAASSLLFVILAMIRSRRETMLGDKMKGMHG